MTAYCAVFLLKVRVTFEVCLACVTHFFPSSFAAPLRVPKSGRGRKITSIV